MFEGFKIQNNDQRKFVANLFGVACIAWASPIYNFLINLGLQSFNFSLKYLLTLLVSLVLAGIFFNLGIIILRGVKQ